MNRNFVSIFLVVCSALVVAAVPPSVIAAVSDSDGDILLQVHLPREITVRDSLLNLGQISVVRGAGPLVAKARGIAMGRFSAPSQKVVLDRSTILSRLASCGIPPEKVRLTGAEAVMVRRQQEVLESEDFVETARQFLKQTAPASAVYEAIPLVRPKDLALTGEPEDIQLEPQLMSSTARGLVTVQVQVIADGRDIGSRNIPFRLRYECRRVVTRSDIAEGTVLTSENVKIEKKVSNRPEPVGWKPPYGLVATRALPGNMEIRDDMIHSARPDAIVRRNRTVVIRIERPGLTVTAVGTALQEARTGETLKVRNEDSRRVIVCTVNPDGTVEPVL